VRLPSLILGPQAAQEQFRLDCVTLMMETLHTFKTPYFADDPNLQAMILSNGYPLLSSPQHSQPLYTEACKRSSQQNLALIPHLSNFVSFTQVLSFIGTENAKINSLHFQAFISVICASPESFSTMTGSFVISPSLKTFNFAKI
jgi:hypothetical protein